jgi:superfamily I DNA/RNA helicase
VRGLRSRRLRLNYRTTQNIRNWAVATLRDMSVDDLDEGTDDALKGYHSLRLGTVPEVAHHTTEKAEATFIVERLRSWTAKGRALGDICITARTNRLVEKRYAPILRDAGFDVQIIKTDESKLGDGVRLATMHRIKGLEFPCVLIAGVEAGTVPLELKSYADESARKDHLDTERRLLFVAATRARDELVVTGFGTRSEFLKG